MGEPMVLPWRTPETMWAVSRLDLHASAAAIALLASPEFAVEKRLVDFQSGGQAGEKGDKGFAVRFSGSEVAQHNQLNQSVKPIRTTPGHQNPW